MLEDALTIQPLTKDDLAECASLIQDVFGFRDKDSIPAWEMYVVSQNGGLALGAFVDDELVGAQYAFAAFDGRQPFLHSNGLAVRPEYQDLGIGEMLKLVQRTRALRLGYERIRWTTGALSSRQLYLYLTKLSAQLVDHRRQPMAGLLPDHVATDEVVIDWHLRDAAKNMRFDPQPVSASELPYLATSTEDIGDGLRRFTRSHAEEAPSSSCDLEIPWDVHELQHRSPAVAAEWYAGVATAMQKLLHDGYRGVEVLLDRAARRSFVRFEPPS
jgi:predicted GNAT superfamily acetyltransferase